jgi:hypothetical protein
MKKLLIMSLFALVSAGAYAATPTTNLNGKWTITWIKNGSSASISLNDDNGNQRSLLCRRRSPGRKPLNPCPLPQVGQ